MTKNDNDYPAFKIMVLYSLLGGLVGALLVFMGIVPAIIFNNELTFDDIKLLLAMLIACVMMGSIPSLFAGTMIAMFKIKISKYQDYLKVFLIGIVACLLFSLPFLMLGYNEIKIKFTTVAELTLALSLFSLIGGISSAILAKFILPKS